VEVEFGGNRSGVWVQCGRVREAMSYEQQYPNQTPSGRDGYGNPTYERYTPDYAYEAPTGRDAYGNATYDASSQAPYGGTNEG
jgi:hypothetical protein